MSDNLIPCKPGEVRSTGRPKGSKNIRTILKKFLSIEMKKMNPLTENEETLTTAELIQLKKIAMALSGNIKAIEMIDDRMYGKIKTNFEIDGNLKADLTGLDDTCKSLMVPVIEKKDE